MRRVLSAFVLVSLVSIPVAADPVKIFEIDQSYPQVTPCPPGPPGCAYHNPLDFAPFGQSFTPTAAAIHFVAMWMETLSFPGVSMRVDLFQGHGASGGSLNASAFEFVPTGTESSDSDPVIFEFAAAVPLVSGNPYSWVVSPIISTYPALVSLSFFAGYPGGAGFESPGATPFDMFFAEGIITILDLPHDVDLTTVVPGCPWCAQFVSLDESQVPEPASITLLGIGCGVCGIVRRRKTRGRTGAPPRIS